MRDIENPMVIDSHWRHLEKEPKVIGECAGCQEEVYEHDEWLECMVDGEDVIIHQDSECTYQFVAGRSVCRGQ